MQSIAEAVRGNETYTAQPQKEPQQADWQVNETKEMRAEINRYKQIVNNANGILAEGTAFTADHTLPEAPAKNPSKEKVNYPFTDTAVAKGDKGFVPDDSSKGKKCNGAPFCDEISKGGKISDNKQPTGEKGDVYNEKPIYAPTGSATSMKSKMKPVRFGEGKKKVFKLSQEQLNEYVKARRASINESGEYTDGAPEATHNSDTLGMKKAGGTRIGTDGDAYNEKVHMNEEGEYTDGAPEATHNSDTENYGDGTSDVGTGTPYEKEVGDAETSSLDHSDDVSEDGSFDLDDVAGMPDDNPPYPEVKDDDEDDGDDYAGDDDGIEIDIEDDGDPADYEHPEESYRRRGNRMNEWEGHDFGNHPGYQKIPLTTPNGKAPLTYGHEWADGTEGNGDEPFGLRVGSGSPFDKVIDKLADAVIAHRLSGSKKKLTERKVLAIPNQGQQTDNIPPAPMQDVQDMEQPQQDAGDFQQQGTDDSLQTGGDTDADSQGNPESMNQFDKNFDAGVDANEDEDPKKYIQQLTGKLSQSIRKYNQSQAVPDTDLGKYVVGMIAKQATDGMSDKDINKILKKVKDDDEDDESANESIKRRNKQIDEIFNELVGTQDDVGKPVEKGKVGSFTRKPFTSPKFK